MVADFCRNSEKKTEYRKKSQNNLQVSILFVPLQSLTKGSNTGEMAEWSNAAVLKTVDLNGSGGSNPSLSAEKEA